MSAVFLRLAELVAIHERLIEDTGGNPGLAREGALDSAIAAVENRVHYEDADVIVCAATYLFHITQAHAFIDGNKRIGAAAMEVFLEINDCELVASDDELFELVMSIADGSRARAEAEDWLRPRVRPRPPTE